MIHMNILIWSLVYFNFIDSRQHTIYIWEAYYTILSDWGIHNTYENKLDVPLLFKWRHTSHGFVYNHRPQRQAEKLDYIQRVPGGIDLTSGECSLGQTITI